MAFRTVIVKERAKLDYSMSYLVYRGAEIKKIFISEISILIIESTGVSLTSALINELIKNKVKVIFCDEKHMPSSQLIGFYDNYHSVKNIGYQVCWDNDIKAKVWQNIIINKISRQAMLMEKYGQDSSLLKNYISQVEINDITNREGHSAKVYFNSMFDIMTRRTDCHYNSALNYGYAILLSMFCKEITACGYLTQLGIWHCNEYNYFNLASDFMESFRIIVDELVLKLNDNNNYKQHMLSLVNTKINIDSKNLYIDEAISIYCKSIFSALNYIDESLIKNYSDYELQIYENSSNV